MVESISTVFYGMGFAMPKPMRSSTTTKNVPSRCCALVKEALSCRLSQRSEFFTRVDPTVLAELPRMAKFLEAPKGAVVFRQGDPPENFWMITRGEVGVYTGALRILRTWSVIIMIMMYENDIKSYIII